MQKLPTPHYIVLYNGEANAPDRQTLHLSDAFEKPGGCVEMSAEMYNINYGHNQELMEQCRPLHDYSILVDKIRRYRKSGAMVREAVDRAVEECIREDVLADFLKEHKAEVIGMLLTEYDQAEHLRLVKQEGIDEGLRRGVAEGMAKGIEKGMTEGMEKGTTNTRVDSIRSLMKTLGLSIERAFNALEIPVEERQTYADLINRQEMSGA